MKKTLILTAALAMAACGPKYTPVVPHDAVIPNTSDAVVAKAHAEGVAERARQADLAGQLKAEAMATCTGDICAKVAAGEVALGMNEAQVMVATRTTQDAWDVRGVGGDRVMAPRLGADAPKDAIAEVAMATLKDGAVVAYTYREPTGFRTVATPKDATAVAVADARAAALLDEGDQAMATGDVSRALSLYDRADVLRPGHSETTLRIAKIMDQIERPMEALMRYRLFVHQMELELIEAKGDAAAKIAAAIEQARQRIVVLERYR